MRYYWYKSDDVQQLNMLVTHSVTGTQFRNVDSGYKRLGSLRSALESRIRTLRSKNGEFTQSSPKNGSFNHWLGQLPISSNIEKKTGFTLPQIFGNSRGKILHHSPGFRGHRGLPVAHRGPVPATS